MKVKLGEDNKKINFAEIDLVKKMSIPEKLNVYVLLVRIGEDRMTTNKVKDNVHQVKLVRVLDMSRNARYRYVLPRKLISTFLF